MFSKLILLVFLALCLEVELRVECPFKLKSSPRRNCERNKQFRDWLKIHPENKFSRPDRLIDVGYETDEDRYCCYERRCALECGVNLEEIVWDFWKYSFPDEVSKLVKHYFIFFQNVNRTEVEELENGTASTLVHDKWTSYLAHLATHHSLINRRMKRIRNG